MKEILTAWQLRLCLQALTVVQALFERHPDMFQGLIGDFVPILFDAIGDNRDRVREESSNLLLALLGRKSLFREIEPDLRAAFSHKSAKTRDSALLLCKRLLSTDFELRPLIPSILRCLEDASESVRTNCRDVILSLFR